MLAERLVGAALRRWWFHDLDPGRACGHRGRGLLPRRRHFEGPSRSPTASASTATCVAALSRPSLRAYVTWASWSDAFVGMVAPVRYGDQTHGLAVGVQLETWW